jgi:alpha-glucosidase
MKTLWPAAVLALALPHSAWAAGWASMGDVPAPQRDGQTLTFRNAQGVLALSVLAPEVVRVRFVPKQELGRDHSYAIVGKLPGDAAAVFDVQTDHSTIRTSALTVTVGHRPLRVAFATAAGLSLDEDDASRGIGFVDETVRVWKRLRDDEMIYGFGEKTGRLNKRGRNLGGYTRTSTGTATPSRTGTTPTPSTRRSRSTW